MIKHLFLKIFLFIFISMNSQTIDIVNPENNIGLKNWNIVNDDVMGGISKSYLSLNDENNLIFSGNVSLRNNGGFASTRMGLDRESLNGIRSFKIKFRGDGNIYKLRVRQNNRRAAYSSNFKSVKDKWLEVNIPIGEFTPSWRGYSYRSYPAIETEKISSIGIQISDNQEGEFKLEIKYIKAIF